MMNWMDGIDQALDESANPPRSNSPGTDQQFRLSDLPFSLLPLPAVNVFGHVWRTGSRSPRRVVSSPRRASAPISSDQPGATSKLSPFSPCPPSRDISPM